MEMTANHTRKHPIIIFDLGGVLLDWDPRHLLRKLFPDNKEEMDHFLEVVCPQEWNINQDKGYPFPRAIRERQQLFPEYGEIIQAYYDRWEEMVAGQIQGTVDIMAELRKVGYPLYALSNWSSEMFNRIRGQFEFLDWFDDMVISSEVKMVKPHREIFDLLLSRIQGRAEDCLFIDDHAVNTDAAEALGFQTILFKSPEQLKKELAARGLM
jgi:2-haloacid dehalogenase